MKKNRHSGFNLCVDAFDCKLSGTRRYRIGLSSRGEDGDKLY